MSAVNNKLSVIKIIAVVLIGLALVQISMAAVFTMVEGFAMKAKVPYLYESYMPYRELMIIGGCCVVFALMLIFNMRMKCKWVSALVNIIVILALYNPFTFVISAIAIPTIENHYEIESESEFDHCVYDMGIDLRNFPKYKDFGDQDVRFVGKVSSGSIFFYQSVTAIVKYDSIEQCEADYNAYIDSHQFLTEPVIAYGDDYLIAAPAFHYDGIDFKVVTEGEADNFPKKIYMIGIDRNNTTLYYLCLEDHDLDYIADSQEQDLAGEMGELIATQFNLG